MSQIVLYFLHSTSGFSFYIDVALTLSISKSLVSDLQSNLSSVLQSMQVRIYFEIVLKRVIFKTHAFNHLMNSMSIEMVWAQEMNAFLWLSFYSNVADLDVLLGVFHVIRCYFVPNMIVYGSPEIFSKSQNRIISNFMKILRHLQCKRYSQTHEKVGKYFLLPQVLTRNK